MDLNKLFLKIADITHGRIARSQTFSDFVAYCALLLSARTDPAHSQSRQEAWKQLMQSYKEPEVRAFQESLLLLCETAANNIDVGRYEDLFGMAYMQIGAPSKPLQQVFTPPDIGRLIAALTMPKDAELPAAGYFTLNDPACGSGTLLLSGVERLAGNGFNTAQQVAVQAVDLDIRCVHMAYLNLSLYGVPAVVIHGNLLTLKEFDRWYTPAYLLGNWIWREPMPLGVEGRASNERLKMMTDPLYQAFRLLSQGPSPSEPGDSTAPETILKSEETA